MKKVGISLLFFVFCISFCNAQDLKRAAEQKKQQEVLEKKQKEEEMQEQARLLKSQLNLEDLLFLLKKDLGDVDKFLEARGWKLEGTNIDEDGEMPDDYERVTWSLDKNEYSGLASGFFHFYRYTKYDNAVRYQMANEEHLQRLENELKTKGYHKTQATDAIARGLESTYRNNQYEVIFRKVRKQKNERGADIQYEFFIYNYKEIEKQREEAERIEREAREKVERLEREAKELEDNYQKAMVEAKQNFEQRQYEQAKQNYQYARKLKPQNAHLIDPKIEEIDKISQFISERQYKTYNYEQCFAADYSTINDIIISDLKTILRNEKSLPLATATFTAAIDTAGVTSMTFNSAGLNEKLIEKLKQITNNIKLKQPLLNGYSVRAEAVFRYTISVDETTVKVKNNASGIQSDDAAFDKYRSNIRQTLSTAPMGRFTFLCNNFTINNKEYTENRLIKYKGTGGGGNAWLSLLVPGLGDHRVTYSQRKGIGIALGTYGLIGVGIGCKSYAMTEYKKYHAATEQSAMDEHYKNANFANQGFYLCVGAGAALWLYDIIWVWAKGAKNHKEQKIWKQSHISFYYMPEASGLTYTFNF